MGPWDSFDQSFAMMRSFVIFFFVVVAGVIVFAIIKAASRSAKNAAAPEVSAQATVVDKRSETHGGGETMVSQSHFVTFEQSSGERFELQVSGEQYGQLVVGDRGAVAMKGTRYLGFSRELMR